MKKIYLHSLFLCALFAALLTACSEDDSGMNMAPETQLLQIDEADVFRTVAKLNANIVNTEKRSIVETGFIVSTDADFENLTMDAIRASQTCKVIATNEPVTNGAMNHFVTGLAPNTQYYYCAYASSGYSVTRSSISSFKTPIWSKPVFTDPEVTDVSMQTCNVTFSLLDIGDDNIEMQDLRLFVKKVGENEMVTDLDANDFSILLPNDISTLPREVKVTNLEKGTRYGVWVKAITTRPSVGYSEVTYLTTSNYEASFINPVYTTNLSDFTVKASFTTPEVVVDKGIMYSRETDYPTELNHMISDNTSADNEINVTITDLDNGTYYVRPYVRINKEDKMFYIYGDVAEVAVGNITKPTLADNFTISDSDIEDYAVTVRSQVTYDGGMKPTEYGFCYIIDDGSPLPEIEDIFNKAQGVVVVPKRNINVDGNQIFTARITGLNSETSYVIWAYSTNANGTVFTNPERITTKIHIPAEGDINFPEF